MLLLLMILLLVATAVLVLTMRETRRADIETFSLTGAILTVMVAILTVAWALPTFAGDGQSNGLFSLSWGPLAVGAIDFRFHLGIDGISLWLILMSAVAPAIFMAAGHGSQTQRPKEYYALILLLSAAAILTFSARDLLLFFIGFELSLVPLYLLVGGWGIRGRNRAAITMFVYAFVGSMLLFAAVLYLGYKAWLISGVYSFDLRTLEGLARGGHLSVTEQMWLFMAMFAGFAVKVPIFPFHTWLPQAHRSSDDLCGVDACITMVKLGVYGFVQIALPLAPLGALAAAPYVATIAVIGVLFASLCAWRQYDVKSILAYSSVAHLGLCVLGVFSMTNAGLSGAALYLVNYALIAGSLFLMAGMLFQRTASFRLLEFGGLSAKMPIFAGFLIFFAMCSAALPGTNGFVSEFLVLFGAFNSANPAVSALPGGGPLHPVFAVVAGLSVVLTSVYVLNLVRQVAFGPLNYPGYVPPHAEGLHGDDHAGQHAPGDAHGSQTLEKLVTPLPENDPLAPMHVPSAVSTQDPNRPTPATIEEARQILERDHPEEKVFKPPAPGTGMGFFRKPLRPLEDLTTHEIVVLAIPALMCLILGVASSPITMIMHTRSQQVVEQIRAAGQATANMDAAPQTVASAGSAQSAETASPTAALTGVVDEFAAVHASERPTP